MLHFLGCETNFPNLNRLKNGTNFKNQSQAICIIVSRLKLNSAKGQLNSEWIFEVIDSPKIPTKNFPDFSSERVGQKSGKILVGILGETMTS